MCTGIIQIRYKIEIYFKYKKGQKPNINRSCPNHISLYPTRFSTHLIPKEFENLKSWIFSVFVDLDTVWTRRHLMSSDDIIVAVEFSVRYVWIERERVPRQQILKIFFNNLYFSNSSVSIMNLTLPLVPLAFLVNVW